MRKHLSVILSAIASVILIFVLLFTAVEIAINDNTFINNEYTKLGLAREMGMNNADLVNSCIRLIDYMQGEVESIDILVTINGEEKLMFEQEQEIVHMQDVQRLYLTCKGWRDTGIVAMLVLYILSALLSFRSAVHSIAKGFLWGAFLAGLVIGFVGTWAALDFSSFWTAFHETLFWNDLWLFDPTESRMINILPETFFKDLVIRIVIYGGAALVVLLVLAIFTLIFHQRRLEKAYEAALEAAEAAEARRKAQQGVKKAPKILSPEERQARLERKRRLAKKRAAEQAAAEGTPRRKKQRGAEETVRPQKNRRAAEDGSTQTPKKKRKKREDLTPEQIAMLKKRKKQRMAEAEAEQKTHVHHDGIDPNTQYDPDAEYPNEYPEYEKKPDGETENA